MISPLILQHYRELIDAYSQQNTHVQDPYQQPSHLIWMLTEIKNNNNQSDTKKHRWLGFIQGILIAKGITNVDVERDFTRDLFNGD